MKEGTERESQSPRWIPHDAAGLLPVEPGVVAARSERHIMISASFNYRYRECKEERRWLRIISKGL